jgi:hypothetical protein
MKIYYLSQDSVTGYDTYSDCVVIAESESDAKTISPTGHEMDGSNEYYLEWPKSVDEIECEEIGTANENQKRGVVCSSFHAG